MVVYDSVALEENVYSLFEMLAIHQKVRHHLGKFVVDKYPVPIIQFGIQFKNALCYP